MRSSFIEQPLGHELPVFYSLWGLSSFREDCLCILIQLFNKWLIIYSGVNIQIALKCGLEFSQVLVLEGKMVRRDFCLEVSAGKVSLWCFVMETSLQISSESYVFGSSSSPELIMKQKK